MIKVAKFGGSSCASAEQFRKVKDIVLSDKSRHYIVVSAPGKRASGDTKVTDLLYRLQDAVADEKKFCEAGKKYNILMVPGSSFACPGYVRLAYCVSYETIINSLPKFAELAKEYF